MSKTPDLVAALVQQEYDKLPAKRKPVVRGNGVREWVPLSGIVAEGQDGKLTCLSLATGMKCLPSSQLFQANGNVLHDWHAEILAIRAFNVFVLDECLALTNGTKVSSDFIRLRKPAEREPSTGEESGDGTSWHDQPFTWREDVLLHMYCSEAPCGDASMELIMAAQADASPWDAPPTASAANTLPGRAYFSQLGIVRRKPARGDAPASLSKSCSDKLSLKQCTSLLSSLPSLLVSPENVYLSTLILPRAQYSASGCQRAFSCSSLDTDPANKPRMAPLSDKIWGGGYAFKPFEVKTTDLEFAFSRRPPSSPSQSSSQEGLKLAPSNLATAVSFTVITNPIPATTKNPTTTSPPDREESTLNGVLRGQKASSPSERGASFATRRKMWILAAEVSHALMCASSDTTSSMKDSNSKDSPKVNGDNEGNLAARLLSLTLREQTRRRNSENENGVGNQFRYGDIKNYSLLETRRRVKQDARSSALKGWVRNLGDEDFVL
ncbi:adenosine deaminase/editase [Xylariaceae sp. FL0255]|nr:adenosine deaminase/editase [Xylariaceae sp. FL0255]